jgi:hypothetical protein
MGFPRKVARDGGTNRLFWLGDKHDPRRGKMGRFAGNLGLGCGMVAVPRYDFFSEFW